MDKVIRYVNTTRGDGQKESLERLYLLLEGLGNPQKTYLLSILPEPMEKDQQLLYFMQF